MDAWSRRRLLQAAGTGFGIAVAGCQSDGADADGTATDAVSPTDDGDDPTNTAGTGTNRSVHVLTDYAGESWESRWEEQLVPAFDSELGIEVDVEYLGMSIAQEKRQRVESLLDEGAPPDAVTANLWDEDVGYFLANGMLSPVSGAVEDVQDAVGPLVGTPARVRGEYYVAPHALLADTIHYRTDVLAEYGLDSPHTLETLAHNARVIDEEAEDLDGFAFPRDGIVHRFFTLALNAHGGHLWRWTDGDGSDPTVWFPDARVRETLEYLRTLAPHAGDTRDTDSSDDPYVAYGRGAAAQAHTINALGAGVAASLGNDGIVESTALLPFPTHGDRTPVARLRPIHDGVMAFDFDGTADAALADVVEYLYRDPERAGTYYDEVHGTLRLPAWEGVFDSSAYRTQPAFERRPHLHDLVRTVGEDVAPLAPASDDLVVTPATLYAEGRHRFPPAIEAAIVGDREIGPAIREARTVLAETLAEGRRLVRNKFRSGATQTEG